MDIKSYISLLNVAKQSRKRLIDDFYENNANLFDVLYDVANSEASKVKAEFYELKWIQYHFDLIKELEIEDNAVYSIFTDFYRDYLKDIYSSDFDPVILNTKIKELNVIISQTDKWEDNVKQIEVSFKKEKKLLKQRIDDLKAKKGIK